MTHPTPLLPHSDEMADRDLARRMAAGEIDALRQLYQRHGTRSYGFAHRLIGDAAEAEEITQEVFVQAWRRAATYDPGKASPWAWLALLTRSVCLGRLRQRRPRGGAESVSVPPSDAAPGGPDDAPAGQFIGLLDRLQPEERQCLTEVLLEGRTHEEAAARTGLALDHVINHIRRSLTKLRQFLASHDS